MSSLAYVHTEGMNAAVRNALEQLTTRTTSASGGPVGQVAYTYNLDGHLINEATASSGVKTREYIWLPALVRRSLGVGGNDNNPVDLPLAVIDVATKTISYVHADHLGRPIRMTNTAKATVWAATWKPWGEVQTLSGTNSNNLRFPGQYFQIETGFHYNHHRMYDPVTGRYTQPDPLGFVDGSSIYAYAKNSPYMQADRDGLFLGSKTPAIPSGARASGLGGQCSKDDGSGTSLLHLIGGVSDKDGDGVPDSLDDDEIEVPCINPACLQSVVSSSLFH